MPPGWVRTRHFREPGLNGLHGEWPELGGADSRCDADEVGQQSQLHEPLVSLAFLPCSLQDHGDQEAEHQAD